jgi:hypothetical protein
MRPGHFEIGTGNADGGEAEFASPVLMERASLSFLGRMGQVKTGDGQGFDKGTATVLPRVSTSLPMAAMRL